MTRALNLDMDSVFSNSDIAKHYPGKAIVELQADRTAQRTCRITWVFRHEPAIQSHANQVAPGFYFERVPVDLVLNAAYGRRKQVDASTLEFFVCSGVN